MPAPRKKHKSPRSPSPSRNVIRPRKAAHAIRARKADSETDTPPKRQALEQSFKQLWAEIFSSPVHLDSALSKRPPRMKRILAQLVPPILLRPVSTAEALGVGMAPEEPWSLSPEKLAHWRAAWSIAERLYDAMPSGGISVDSRLEDFPPWMVAEWIESWGADAAAALATSLARDPPLGLRATRKVGPEALIKALGQGGQLPVKASPSKISPVGVRLDGYAPVLGSDAFARGEFEIQDEGSQVMALFSLFPEIYGNLLQKAPGPNGAKKPPALPGQSKIQSFVDACAGAGGKSLAIADALGGRGRIFSYDISAKKLQALRRRATHAGFNNIQSVALEAGKEREALARFKGKADVVLVDAPCSGWGVLRRNPDIKWRQDRAALERMPKIQRELLSQYSELVAPGGRLVFGVCTYRRDETTGVVEAFVKANPAFSPNRGGYLGPDPCDGFFMQAFTRKK